MFLNYKQVTDVGSVSIPIESTIWTTLSSLIGTCADILSIICAVGTDASQKCCLLDRQ